MGANINNAKGRGRKHARCPGETIRRRLARLLASLEDIAHKKGPLERPFFTIALIRQLFGLRPAASYPP